MILKSIYSEYDSGYTTIHDFNSTKLNNSAVGLSDPATVKPAPLLTRPGKRETALRNSLDHFTFCRFP